MEPGTAFRGAPRPLPRNGKLNPLPGSTASKLSVHPFKLGSGTHWESQSIGNQGRQESEVICGQGLRTIPFPRNIGESRGWKAESWQGRMRRGTTRVTPGFLPHLTNTLHTHTCMHALTLTHASSLTQTRLAQVHDLPVMAERPLVTTLCTPPTLAQMARVLERG